MKDLLSNICHVLTIYYKTYCKIYNILLNTAINIIHFKLFHLRKSFYNIRQSYSIVSQNQSSCRLFSSGHELYLAHSFYTLNKILCLIWVGLDSLINKDLSLMGDDRSIYISNNLMGQLLYFLWCILYTQHIWYILHTHKSIKHLNEQQIIKKNQFLTSDDNKTHKKIKSWNW